VIEGVDSNQWWPLKYKLCMNIDDVCFGKSEIYIDGPSLALDDYLILGNSLHICG
jgi:hypothetical protein